jgi:hypothetical protein
MKYNYDSGAPTCQIQVAANKYQAAISSQWDQHEQLGDQARGKPSQTQIELKWLPGIVRRYLL